MEDLLEKFCMKIIDKLDPTALVLIFIILLLSWLLCKIQSRLDEFIKELTKNSQTLASLTEIIRQLIYGKQQ